MFRRWRRARAVKKVKPGDRRALKQFQRWQILSRSVFTIELADPDGTTHEYAVDVQYFDLDGKVGLYREGRQVATATVPAVFPVPGGVLEVNTTMFGLSRMHFVPDDGEARPLRPHPHSAEAARAGFGRRFPRASAVVAGAAVVVLLAGLALGVPQLVEWVSHQPVVAERVGTFTFGLSVPAWANTTLVVGGMLAALERALTLRNHWLIDAETWWMGD